jgi:hypothetical protein
MSLSLEELHVFGEKSAEQFLMASTGTGRAESYPLNQQEK